MNLGDMTRDQLWALGGEFYSLEELCIANSINDIPCWYHKNLKLWVPDVNDMLNFLEQLRLELQQEAADSRRETQQER